MGIRPLLPLPAFLFLAGHLIAAVVTDLRCGRIPNRLVVSLAAGGIAASAWNGFQGLTQALAGGALALVVLTGLSLLSSGSIGGGDIKLMTAAGLYLGPAMTFHALIWTFVMGGVVSLVMLSSGLTSPRGTVPYAPAIAIGVLLSVFRG